MAKKVKNGSDLSGLPYESYDYSMVNYQLQCHNCYIFDLPSYSLSSSFKR